MSIQSSPVLDHGPDIQQRFAAALAAKAQGRKVIGLIGTAMPIEMVLAAGAFPLGLTARAQDVDVDPAPMETEHETEIRSLFLQATTGVFALCDAIVIASTADGYRYLFQYLTEMKRTGQGAPLPEIRLYDFLLGPGEPVTAYDRTIMAAFGQWLAELTGTAPTTARVDDAIEAVNGVREVLGQLAQARLAGQVAGSEALALIAAGTALEPEQHRAVIQDALSQRSQALSPRPRLVVATAVNLYHRHLHDTLEAAGGHIVAEDGAWAARHLGPVIAKAGDPFAALLDHYRTYDPSPRHTGPLRDAWLRAAMDTLADGIVFYVPPDDQFWGWRYPALRAYAEGLGKPCLLIREDALSLEGQRRIMHQARDWLTQSFGEQAA